VNLRGQCLAPLGQCRSPSGQCLAPLGQCRSPSGQCLAPSLETPSPSGQRLAPSIDTCSPSGQCLAPSIDPPFPVEEAAYLAERAPSPAARQPCTDDKRPRPDDRMQPIVDDGAFVTEWAPRAVVSELSSAVDELLRPGDRLAERCVGHRSVLPPPLASPRPLPRIDERLVIVFSRHRRDRWVE
jgi:hypothetical protein